MLWGFLSPKTTKKVCGFQRWLCPNLDSVMLWCICCRNCFGKSRFCTRNLSRLVTWGQQAARKMSHSKANTTTTLFFMSLSLSLSIALEVPFSNTVTHMAHIWYIYIYISIWGILVVLNKQFTCCDYMWLLAILWRWQVALPCIGMHWLPGADCLIQYSKHFKCFKVMVSSGSGWRLNLSKQLTWSRAHRPMHPLAWVRPDSIRRRGPNVCCSCCLTVEMKEL